MSDPTENVIQTGYYVRFKEITDFHSGNQSLEDVAKATIRVKDAMAFLKTIYDQGRGIIQGEITNAEVMAGHRFSLIQKTDYEFTEAVDILAAEIKSKQEELKALKELEKKSMLAPIVKTSVSLRIEVEK